MQINARLQEDRALREALGRTATVREPRAPACDVIVENLSASGCLVHCERSLAIGTAITIGIAGIGIVPARIVRADGAAYGCAFVTPIRAQAVALAKTADPVVQGRFGDAAASAPQTIEPAAPPTFAGAARSAAYLGGYALWCVVALPAIAVAAIAHKLRRTRAAARVAQDAP